MIHHPRTTHADDLMKPDLLSEILLAASGVLLFVPLLLIVAAAFTQAMALR